MLYQSGRTSWFLEGRPARSLLGLLVGTATALQIASPAAAQAVAPSQVTPREIAPPPMPSATSPKESIAPTAATPVDGADLEFDSGDGVIDGAFAEMATANATFLASVGHRHLTVAQVFATARALEQAYAKHGFILARVVVPRQKLVSGDTVRVTVIDGFIEDVDVTHLPAAVQSAVRARVQPLVGLRHITEAQIERALLLSSDLAGLHLRSALARGASNGGVRLVLEGELDRLAARIGADNRLPATLGQWQWNANLALNNLFRQGDQAYLTLGSGLANIGHTAASGAPLGMIGGGLIAPIGSDGFTLAGEFLHSRTRVATVGMPVSVGEFSRGEIRARQSLILTRHQSLSLTGTADLITQSLTLPDFATQFSRDHYYALRLGMNWQRWIGNASVSLDGTLSQGVGGRRGDATLPNSRQGTSPTFTRFDGTARASVPLGAGFGLDVTARGQSSFGKPEFLSEQFALDADNAVSAFPSGSFNADSGVTLRSELGFPPTAPIKGVQAGMYLYAAGGEGWLARPTTVEQSMLRAASLGFGTRIGLNALPLLSHAGATIGFEFGHQFSNIIGRSSGNRASLTASLRF